MKIIINIFLFFSLIFVFSNCNNPISPTENTILAKGTYSGTFSVTFKHYQNYSKSITQSGIISILFADSTYKYSAIVSYSSESTVSDSLGDFGSYSIVNDGIRLDDGSWLRMDPSWHNSLYLFDTFNVQKKFSGFYITQDNTFAKWDLNLVLK